MNVSLTPELEKFVNRKVESGLYQTASEVVREGLRLLSERRSGEGSALRREIALGRWSTPPLGQVKPFNEETATRIKSQCPPNPPRPSQTVSEPRLTDQAEADLEKAWEDFAEHNEAAADRLIDDIMARARLHARFPLMKSSA